MRRSNLILNNEWESLFNGLPDDKAGKLIKAAFACHVGKEVKIDDPVLGAVFEMMATVIRENAEKYEQKCEQNAKNRRKKETGVDDCEGPLSTVNDREGSGRNKIKIKENKDKKKIYGEYKKVHLTEKEYQKLLEDFGEEKTEKAIRFLDEYIAEKGYKSKSHYLAIRRWVLEAVDEKKAKSPAGKFQNFDNRGDQEHNDLIAKVIAMQGG